MAPQGVQMKFQGVQNTTFDENPQENERIWAILGCAISSIARAKHGCTGGWLKLWPQHKHGGGFTPYVVPSSHLNHQVR